MNKNTVLEIDKSIFLENAKKIEEYIYPKKIIPVVKANAYGTYLNEEIDIMNHFSILAVARTEEGVFLRNKGYNKEILILNEILEEEIDNAINNNLTIGLSRIDLVDKINKPLKVHLEIETGMNRTGININDLEAFIKKIKTNKNIIVEGIYTHFSSADNDNNYTNKQISIFQKAVNITKASFNLKYIHSQASAGILNFDDKVSNYTRPGILLYGYTPFEGARKIIPVKEVAILKTKISFIKEVDKDEKISYNGTYITPHKMVVGTIPIGYADGLRRILSNNGEVIVNNTKCKIIGNICMDSCMIDITNTNAKIEDDVYIWDNKLITLEEISKKCNTISYEILATISKRITRIIK